MKNHFLFLTLLLACGSAYAGENAAPSSHLVFDDTFEGDILINQVRVTKAGEALYTYYEALGWRGEAAGYSGIQAHPRAHLYIFSIWDHKKHTAPIQALYHGAGTETQKFGGEGTGLKSWNFKLGWDTDVWYTLVLRAWPVEDHTLFGYWVRSEKTKKWTHMVTMDVAAKNAFFKGGTDAFIEDWSETGVKPRTTHLREGWKRKLTGQWYPFGRGRYSVNAWDLVAGKRSFNYRTNWDAGVARDATGPYYYMTAGGKKTKPTTKNPSMHAIQRTATKPEFAPLAIESVRATSNPDGKVTVTWKTDSSTLPQFSYSVAVHTTPNSKDRLIATAKAVTPQARSATLTISPKEAKEGMYVHLRCKDVLDNESAAKVVKVQGEMR